MKLKNGAKVLSKSKAKDVGFVVLGEKEMLNRTEFVTWLTDDEMNCFHGHYYEELDEAVQDYKSRVNQYC